MCREEAGHEDGGSRQGLEGSPGHCPAPRNLPGTHGPYHVVAGQQLLQELRLLVHHGLDDELVIAGDVEEGAAGAGVGELDQGLVAQRVLEGGWRVGWTGPVCDGLTGDRDVCFAGRLSPAPPPAWKERRPQPTASKELKLPMTTGAWVWPLPGLVLRETPAAAHLLITTLSKAPG